MATFLTGGTGFIGRYLAAALLSDGEEVVALVRCRSRREGRDRLERALAEVGAAAEATRIAVCPGALEEPGLGLDPEDRKQVIESCERFLHCGATTRFDLSLDASRRVNVQGTRGVLELARERARGGAIERVDVISTAFVAGMRRDVVPEQQLDDDPGHKNGYERSKFEAESLVWSAADELPVCVLRPSIVVGHSQTGFTSSFQTIYLPIRIYARGLWRTLPANPACSLDLVPVDFVVDATRAIRRRPDSVGRCFHLSAGPSGELSIGEICRMVEEYFPQRKPIRTVDPQRWLRFARPNLRRVAFGRVALVIKTADALIPYLIGNPSFANENMRKVLGAAHPTPDVRGCFQRLLAYGAATDWGRRTE